MDKLLKRPEVEAVTRLSRSNIYARIVKGTFPEPVRLGPNSVAWRADDIKAWLASLPSARSGEEQPRQAPHRGGGDQVLGHGAAHRSRKPHRGQVPPNATVGGVAFPWRHCTYWWRGYAATRYMMWPPSLTV